MNEVSARCWVFFEAIAARRGVSPEELLSGSGVELERLRDPAQRFDWDVLAHAGRELERRVGRESLEALGAESVDLPAFEPLRRGVGKLLGVGAMYRALKWLLPPFMKNLSVEVTEHDGVMNIALSVPTSHAPSTALFLLAAGMLRRLPTLFGKQECAVTMRAGQHSAELSLDLAATKKRAEGKASQPGARPSNPGSVGAAGDAAATAAPSAAARLYQSLVETTEDPILVVSTKGEIRYGNPALARRLGRALPSLLGRSFFDHIHPEDLPRLVAELGGRSKGEPQPFELPVRLSNGSGGYVRHTLAGVDQSADPFVAGIALRARELAEQRSSNGDSSRELALLATVPGVAYRCGIGPDLEFQVVTDGARELFGVEPSSLVGSRLVDRVHTNDRTRRAEHMAAALVERRPTHIEYRVMREDGQIRWVLDVCRGVSGSDGVLVAVEGFLSDVTDRKHLEEKLLHAQKLEGIGRLAGGIAHDFNNLLGAIMGYADLAKSGLSADDERRADIGQIEVSARRATELTRQLLSFARKQPTEPKTIDLAALLLRVDSMLRRVLGEDVELSTVLPQQLWPIYADPGQVEQIVVNLAVNARDAMPDGGSLVVEARNVELERNVAERYGVAPGPYVQVDIVDSGVGMSEEVKKHLFEPFFTTKETGKGTGLGLATVYGIVAQATGGIRVESVEGEGTAFSIVFPRALGPTTAVVSTPSGPIPRGWETVLVVEDHALVRRATVRALEGQGYRVLTAANAAEAIAALSRAEAPVDLLLTDMIMPDMSGKQLAEKLSTLHPALKVLFVSGYADLSYAGDEGKRGVGFLAKPFTPATLGRKVRELLD